MQEMTSNICNATKVGETKRLRDTRDDKFYWVSKMLDGNCWMVQNLDYDGGGKKVDSIDGFINNQGMAYYDPGEYIYTTPSIWNSCYPNGTYPSTLAECANTTYGWKNVASMQPYLAPVSEDEVIDLARNFYDAHYLAGNYYQYRVAANDICPENWMLPAAYRESEDIIYDIDKTFPSLLSAYGIRNSAISPTTGQDIRLAPLYLLTAGRAHHYAELQRGTLMDPGLLGAYWSAWTKDADGKDVLSNSLYFYEYGTTLWHLGAGNGNGFSVRCVAK